MQRAAIGRGERCKKVCRRRCDSVRIKINGIITNKACLQEIMDTWAEELYRRFVILNGKQEDDKNERYGK